MYEQIRKRAERVERWANLHGDVLEDYLRVSDDDAETRQVFADALWLGGDVLMLLPLLERDGE